MSGERELAHVCPNIGRTRLARDDKTSVAGRRRTAHQQGRQVREFRGRRRADGGRTPCDDPGVVGEVAGGDQVVQRGQRSHSGDRHEVVARNRPNLAFHPALSWAPPFREQKKDPKE